MRRPVADYLRREGMLVMHEVPINGRVADLVGIGNLLTAVELKLSDWRRGLLQAMTYQLACDRVYLCMPFEQALGMLSRSHYLEREGVGLLGCLVGRKEVRVVIPALPSRRLLPFMADALRRSAHRRVALGRPHQTASLSLLDR